MKADQRKKKQADLFEMLPQAISKFKKNIFEPFFSTKEGGTGLGLTVSYNIVTAHGGTLDLVNEHDLGACFRLFLPIGDKQ